MHPSSHPSSIGNKRINRVKKKKKRKKEVENAPTQANQSVSRSIERWS